MFVFSNFIHIYLVFEVAPFMLVLQLHTSQFLLHALLTNKPFRFTRSFKFIVQLYQWFLLLQQCLQFQVYVFVWLHLFAEYLQYIFGIPDYFPSFCRLEVVVDLAYSKGFVVCQLESSGNKKHYFFLYFNNSNKCNMLVPLQFGSNVRATYAVTRAQHASCKYLCVFAVLVLCVFFELTFQLSSFRKVISLL